MPSTTPIPITKLPHNWRFSDLPDIIREFYELSPKQFGTGLFLFEVISPELDDDNPNDTTIQRLCLVSLDSDLTEAVKFAIKLVAADGFITEEGAPMLTPSLFSAFHQAATEGIDVRYWISYDTLGHYQLYALLRTPETISAFQRHLHDTMRVTLQSIPQN